MRRFMAIVALFSGILAAAQTTQDEFRAAYERQVRFVGPAGPGVENILEKWDAAFPEDPAMLEGKFNHYLAKSRRTEVVAKPLSRFMGSEPVLTLKDSLGNNVNYFQEDFFDDDLYAMSASAIDRAIALHPDDLAYRVDLLSSLLAYEKECPDMVTMELSNLIDLNGMEKPAWKFRGEAVDASFFTSMVQEYCASFYSIASPDSFESFRAISSRMLQYDSKSTLFLSNLGTYWLVVKKNDKMALKYYNKVLKIDPKDYSAVKNCVLLSRRAKNVKLERKYLPVLIEVTPDERERESCRMRLEAMAGK